jgi:hypothetical protein
MADRDKYVTRKQIDAEGGTAHRFELAGLGRAPFRPLGITENLWRSADGSVVKPGGSCDYCGQGIRFEMHVRSADGRKFKVGLDCAAKIGDAGLKRYASAAKREHNRKLREARELRKREAADVVYARLDASAELRDRLSAMPHPRAIPATPGGTVSEFFAGRTRLDWVAWMRRNAGTRGYCDAATWIERVEAGQIE